MLAQYTCAIRAVTGAGLAPQVKKVSPGVWTVVTQLPLKLQPPPVAFLLPAQVAVQVVVAPQLLEMCSHPIATLPVPTSRAAAGEVVPIPTCPRPCPAREAGVDPQVCMSGADLVDKQRRVSVKRRGSILIS